MATMTTFLSAAPRTLLPLLLLCSAASRTAGQGLTESLLLSLVHEVTGGAYEPPDRGVPLPQYDFVVVGAGTAGCALAARLTEVAGWSVLLVEAGGRENFAMDIPIVANMLQFSEANWKYRTQPSDKACLGMSGHRCNYPRGKVMGGSSVLNYMIYNRGHPNDYDNWERMGSEGWAFKDVLPYFKKLENMMVPELRGDSRWHHRDGPVSVSRLPWNTPLGKAFVDAGLERGMPLVDYNGAQQVGIAPLQVTLNNGSRWSSNRAYLSPLRGRNGPSAGRGVLHVLKRAQVTRVLIKNQEAEGVELVRGGRRFTVRARREVILAAGAINSPQLLMLSGIGPRQHLQVGRGHPRGGRLASGLQPHGPRVGGGGHLPRQRHRLHQDGARHLLAEGPHRLLLAQHRAAHHPRRLRVRGLPGAGRQHQRLARPGAALRVRLPHFGRHLEGRLRPRSEAVPAGVRARGAAGLVDAAADAAPSQEQGARDAARPQPAAQAAHLPQLLRPPGGPGHAGGRRAGVHQDVQHARLPALRVAAARHPDPGVPPPRLRLARLLALPHPPLPLHHLPPERDVPHGPPRRPAGRAGPASPRAGRRQAARRGRLRHAHDPRRAHQRAHLHDRREGGRHDQGGQRRGAARQAQQVGGGRQCQATVTRLLGTETANVTGRDAGAEPGFSSRGVKQCFLPTFDRGKAVPVACLVAYVVLKKGGSLTPHCHSLGSAPGDRPLDICFTRKDAPKLKRISLKTCENSRGSLHL